MWCYDVPNANGTIEHSVKESFACVKRETRFVMNDWDESRLCSRSREKSALAAPALSNDRLRTYPSYRLKTYRDRRIVFTSARWGAVVRIMNVASVGAVPPCSRGSGKAFQEHAFSFIYSRNFFADRVGEFAVQTHKEIGYG